MSFAGQTIIANTPMTLRSDIPNRDQALKNQFKNMKSIPRIAESPKAIARFRASILLFNHRSISAILLSPHMPRILAVGVAKSEFFLACHPL